ncbi:hypothetical protein FGG08_002043 [Glutinoglossum americanum]|uniref:Uncharacterized protein n=1 Tax=Glutinoglossum americanum TaxID=1670608 RepID=A0A9P8I6Y5_9PEZI|nr:hypothetical protein FGG08_002043 [Glutinoglossum americanum]
MTDASVESAEVRTHPTASRMSSFELIDHPSTTNTSFSSVPPDIPSAAQSQDFDGRPQLSDLSSSRDMHQLGDAVRGLCVRGDISSSSKSSGIAISNGLIQSDTVSSEDPTQSFPSDLSIKAPSLDGKSVTSGTTFALDEKESLRPDDSASAKAAEEEDSYSGPGSVAAGSRVGSEASARAFGDQFYEIAERIGEPSKHDGGSARFPAPIPAEPGPPNIVATFEKDGNHQQFMNPVGGFPVPGIPFGFASDPDEKLLEALETPKDRLFLLRLEQEVIEFVKDTAQLPTLDLPPSNSFYRLLTHKLADYYFLTHFVDSTVGAVRLFRTPYCRLPPPLTSIANPAASTGNTPPPNAPAMKIMRRAAAADKEKQKQMSDSENENAPKSESPSKAASEAGGDSASDGDKDGVISRAESVSAKEKSSMTREEREAKYREARERIFKGFKESSDNPEDSGSAADAKEMSRTSSNSGQDKNHGASSKGGSKQRAVNDDGFEARSQFNVYYPPTQYPAPPFAGTAPYGSFPMQPINACGQVGGMPFVGGQQQYLPAMPQAVPPNAMPQYPMPQHQFYTGPVGGGRGQGFDQMNQIAYTPPVQPPRGAQGLQQPGIPQQQIPMINPNVANSYNPNNRQQPLQNGQPWAHAPQPPYPNQFQAQGFTQPQTQPMDRRNYSSPGNIPSQTQYPYGQLPSKPFAPGPYLRQQQQHPVPGSYNRQPFNPQTQSFIPGGGFPMSQTGSNGAQPYPSPVPSQFGNSPNMAPGFPRQGPGPVPTNFAPQPLPTGNLNVNAMQAQYGGGVMSPQVPPPVQQTNLNHLPRQPQGSIAKWGSNNSLPKKPPPPNLT